MLYHNRLLKLVEYDPEEGSFTYLQRHSAPVVSSGANKYLRVYLDGEAYLAHRLAWFYMTGMWPEGDIDHRDLNKSNNKWSNLRVATDAENMQNKPLHKNNKTGYTGVSWCKRSSRFIASIMKDGKAYRLGGFTDPLEAHNAYVLAKERLHTFNPKLAQDQTASEFALEMGISSGKALMKQEDFVLPEPSVIQKQNLESDHNNEAQRKFDERYITGPEIVTILDISRATLMTARKSGKLPNAISVGEGMIYVWERDSVNPILKQWKEELVARRGGDE